MDNAPTQQFSEEIVTTEASEAVPKWRRAITWEIFSAQYYSRLNLPALDAERESRKKSLPKCLNCQDIPNNHEDADKCTYTVPCAPCKKSGKSDSCRYEKWHGRTQLMDVRSSEAMTKWIAGLKQRTLHASQLAASIVNSEYYTTVMLEVIERQPVIANVPKARSKKSKTKSGDKAGPKAKQKTSAPLGGKHRSRDGVNKSSGTKERSGTLQQAAVQSAQAQASSGTVVDSSPGALHSGFPARRDDLQSTRYQTAFSPGGSVAPSPPPPVPQTHDFGMGASPWGFDPRHGMTFRSGSALGDGLNSRGPAVYYQGSTGSGSFHDMSHNEPEPSASIPSTTTSNLPGALSQQSPLQTADYRGTGPYYRRDLPAQQNLATGRPFPIRSQNSMRPDDFRQYLVSDPLSTFAYNDSTRTNVPYPLAPITSPDYGHQVIPSVSRSDHSQVNTYSLDYQPITETIGATQQFDPCVVCGSTVECDCFSIVSSTTPSDIHGDFDGDDIYGPG